MGSFTEVSLDFDFAPDVPDHVLAAFSRLVGPASALDAQQGIECLPSPIDEPASH